MNENLLMSDKQQATSNINLFQVVYKDPGTQARVGRLATSHGDIETPCFMPCGTQATVKALSSETLEAMGAQIILANAYHLYLRPGEEVFEKVGSLHDFMNWKGAVLTDSGGFQVFSLAPLRKVTDEGLFFQSHIDGSKQFLTPERIVQFQLLLGSDILMVLDECVGYPIGRKETKEAMDRTHAWAERSQKEFEAKRTEEKQHLFGIVQGGVYPDLRRESCERLIGIPFQGYAIGGLGVGEPKEFFQEIVPLCTERLPIERPRYLMGIGTPEDILEGITAGVDLFDCVLPTRNGRNGQVFTSRGTMNLRNAPYAREPLPIEEGCLCMACSGYSRAYLHHLLLAKEILGVTLTTIHNLSFYLRVMKESRAAIQEGRFGEFREETVQRLRSRS